MSMEQHVALVHIKAIMEVILQAGSPFSFGFRALDSLQAESEW